MQTLQTHFYFDDVNKHTISLDTFLKCEGALRTSINHISKVLEIPVSIEVCAIQEGGVINNLVIKVKESPHVSHILVSIVSSVISGLVIYQMTQDSELTELEKDNFYYTLAEQINSEERTLKEVQRTIKSLNTKRLCSFENKAILKKQCSDFYSALRKNGTVTKVSVTSAINNKPIDEDKHTVFKANFDKFIFEDDEIERVDEYADIEIVSPVIKKSKIAWHGIYNDKPIKFSMGDEIFKADVYRKLYSFKTGTRLYAHLVVISKVNDEGLIKDTKFIVTDVYGIYDPSSNQNQLTTKGEARIKEANFTPPTQPDFMLTQQEDI